VVPSRPQMHFDDTDQHGNTRRRRREAILPPTPTATTLRTRHGSRQLTLDFVTHPAPGPVKGHPSPFYVRKARLAPTST